MTWIFRRIENFSAKKISARPRYVRTRNRFSDGTFTTACVKLVDPPAANWGYRRPHSPRNSPGGWDLVGWVASTPLPKRIGPGAQTFSHLGPRAANRPRRSRDADASPRRSRDADATQFSSPRRAQAVHSGPSATPSGVFERTPMGM